MNHEAQLAEANDKISELENELRRIEKSLNAWKKIRDGFLELDGKPAPVVDTSVGPTVAIRRILAPHPDGLTPMEIRKQLVEHGITVGEGKYMMASVHTLIKRDKHIEMIGRGGSKYYRLKPGVSE